MPFDAPHATPLERDAGRDSWTESAEMPSPMILVIAPDGRIAFRNHRAFAELSPGDDAADVLSPFQIDGGVEPRARDHGGHGARPADTAGPASVAPVGPPQPYSAVDAVDLVRRTGRGRRWKAVLATQDPHHGGGRRPSQGVRGVLFADALGDDADPTRASVLIAFSQTESSPQSDKPPTGDGRLLALGKMTARVAHELNNPLDGVLRYLDLAARMLTEAEPHSQDPQARAGPPRVGQKEPGRRSQGAGDRSDAGPRRVPLASGSDDTDGAAGPMERALHYVCSARSGVVHLSSIVRDLLKYARAGHGRHDRLDVNAVVEESLRLLEPLALAHHVVVVSDSQTNPMPCVPAGRLHQVCMNLIKNAIEAMPAGGRLTITTGMASGRIVLTFADTGPGLPPDTGALFQPFYSTKPGGKGSGLGLTIARELVEQMGGAIMAANQEGGGAVFTVAIPAGNAECGDGCPLQCP